jgi:hypothetical protein
VSFRSYSRAHSTPICGADFNPADGRRCDRGRGQLRIQGKVDGLDALDAASHSSRIHIPLFHLLTNERLRPGSSGICTLELTGYLMQTWRILPWPLAEWGRRDPRLSRA